jgi:transposase
MVYVGIDVAKDKHDCYICDSDGVELYSPFIIANNRQGFEKLMERIRSVSDDLSKVKVGLEATGHYSYNILGYLLSKGLLISLINPLHTNLFRKSLSLRQTKTDKVDARTICMMLSSGMDLPSYSDTSYHMEELKSLTRYRFDKVRERAQLKQSLSRLVTILFPELEKLVPTLHMKSVYALLSEFPGATYVAEAHMTRLKHLLSGSSKGRYGKEFAETVRDAARNSIGSDMPAKSLELKHTIALIFVLTEEIDEVETSIQRIMDAMDAPILGIPGINYRMGAMILAELGDMSRFSSPDKILAYAGMSPSTYQSGQLTSSYSHMEKRGSRYLRYALFNATRYVCMWDPIFKAYLEKKRSEGKHYFVAISHAAKKLVRLIYHLQTTGEAYCPMA